MSGLNLITAPAAEPVSLESVKTHLRVDANDDNTLIEAMIIAARTWLEEHYSRRAFVTQTWTQTLDAWPDGNAIILPLPPLQSVTSVVYTDDDGNASTLASSSYVVDIASQPGRVVLTDSESWPSDTLQSASAIVVTYVAGYGLAAAVPEPIKQAIMLMVGDMYENRENTLIAQGVTVAELSFSTKMLLYPYRSITF